MSHALNLSSIRTLACDSYAAYVPKSDRDGKADETLSHITIAAKYGRRHKCNDGVWVKDIFDWIARSVHSGLPALAPDRVLVPVPRSKILEPGDHWAGRRIAQGLRHRGKGLRVEPLLVRTTAQSSSSQSSQRNTIQGHLESMSVSRAADPSAPITLVDDVVTSGTQMAAALLALETAGLGGEDIRGFTVGHTLSPGGDRDQFNHTSTISWFAGDLKSTRL